MKNFNRSKGHRKVGSLNVWPLNQWQNVPTNNENTANNGQAIPWLGVPIMARHYADNPLLYGESNTMDMNSRWYALNNNQQDGGIGRIFTTLSAQQIRQQFGVYARPKITYLAIDIPTGVLSLTPETELEAAEPRKTIDFISKDINDATVANIDHFDMVPMSSDHIAPVQQNLQKITFQGYSVMTLTVNEAQSQRPERIVYDVTTSPVYRIEPRQQQRLQTAMKQTNVPLSDALLPVVEDMYAEHNKRYAPSYKNRCIYVNERVQTFLKYTGHRLKLTDIVMALDDCGQYKPMVFSEWGKMKRISGDWK